MTDKPVESIIIPEAHAEYWDESKQEFIENAYWDEESESIVLYDCSNFYVLLATGDRCYYKTKDRLAAQKQADEDWGIGKYRIRVVQDLKTKPRSDFGISCTGTQTRRGQKK